MTKADFIRAHPDVQAVELVALGAEIGHVFAVGYVHTIRYNVRRKAASEQARPGPATSERAFTAAVADIGIVRAREIIDDVERRISTPTEPRKRA